MLPPSPTTAVCRFAVLHAKRPGDAAAWLAGRSPDRVLDAGPVQIASWGPWRASADGRAEGTLCGTVLSDLAVCQRWVDRGLTLTPNDHPRLSVEEIGAFGPKGVEALRWHGAVVTLHRAQQAVLVARDPQGVGWLGWQRLGDLTVLTTDPAQEGAEVQAVPPGLALRLDRRGIEALMLRPRAQNLPWLREIPEDLRRGEVAMIRAGWIQRLREATAACGRGAGGMIGPEPSSALEELWGSVTSDLLGAAGGQGTWLGLGSILCDDLATAQALPGRSGPWPDPGPAEPTERCGPRDREARLWRAGPLADGWLRQAHGSCLAQGRPLLAPHLDPAVLAWLGAVPPELRRLAAGAGG